MYAIWLTCFAHDVQISWIKSARYSSTMLRTAVVNPDTGEAMPLNCTPEPSTAEQEIVFDYTRFADVGAYGLRRGQTQLDDGGVFVGTKGASLLIRYGTSAPPQPLPERPALVITLPPAPALPYDLVPELPGDFAASCGDYRIFYHKDERWRSGRVQRCGLGGGRTPYFERTVMVFKEMGDDRLLKPVQEPYVDSTFRAIHTAYYSSGKFDAGSNGRWFLHKAADVGLMER
jgi:hypothetical protein